MKIKLGKYEVLSSGTVVGILNEPITFYIEDLVFDIVFKNDVNVEGKKVEGIVSDDSSKMFVYFINFNDQLGAGNTKPMRLATINDRDLYLNHRVYALTDDAGKTLHYTWLLDSDKKGQENG